MATPYGEFEDGKTYCQYRVAQILEVTTDWVIDYFIFPEPEPGSNQEAEPAGVPYSKKGKFYFMSGEDIRLWLQQDAQKPKKRSKPRG